MDVERQIESVIRAAEAALVRGASAAEFAHLFYDESAVVIGEGWPAATRGVSELVPRLEEIFRGWGAGARLGITLVDPLLTDGSVATGFVDATVTPSGPGAPEERYRVLYGWKRGPRGWRVMLEMFAGGST